MSENLNPQSAQMADESMVRNLEAQAIAIWPQERALFLREPLPASGTICDVGCGTGEISARLAELEHSGVNGKAHKGELTHG